jgi:16S rRNA (guanine966-N2)-methyltransferase
MRVVGGKYRGKTLSAPEGSATRPTSDRARESVFNILEHAAWSPGLSGLRVIDLFAGSGALGIEALSRGAAFCLYVETDEAARGAIRANLETMAPDGSLFGLTRVHRRDATDLGLRPASAGAPFDLAFLDPPYRKGLGKRALEGLAAGGWLKSGAIAMWEVATDESVPPPEAYELLDERSYGAARIRFLKLRA